MILLTKIMIYFVKWVFIGIFYCIYGIGLLLAYSISLIIGVIMVLCGYEPKNTEKKTPKVKLEIKDKRKHSKQREPIFDKKYDWIAYWW